MDLNKTLMCFIVTKILHYFWKSNYVAANDRYSKLMFYFVGKKLFLWYGCMGYGVAPAIGFHG
jgi:hypothetical protein